jgi:ketosteroid isomerase-like protein
VWGRILEAEIKSHRDKLFARIMQLADARLKGQFDILESIATDDVVVKVVGNRALSPFAGTFRGKAAGRGVLEALSIEFEYKDVRLDHIMIDNNQVGMRWSGTLRNRGTSAQAHFEGFIHVIFRGELVCEYAAFMDTAAIAQLADWPQSQD